MNILVIAPHPDDEILGVGGTIIKSIESKNKVYVCIVSKYFLDNIDEKIVSQGRNECLSVSKFIGIENTMFLDFPANELSLIPIYKIADKIKNIIDDFEIDEVYVSHYGDVHMDHRVVFDATMVATRPKGKHYPLAVYSYETVSETGWNVPSQHTEFIPNTYIDISKWLNKKLCALNIYKSQLQEFPNARSINSVKALAEYRGSTIGVQAAEAFMLIREIK